MSEMKTRKSTQLTAVVMALVMVFTMWSIPVFQGNDIVNADVGVIDVTNPAKIDDGNGGEYYYYDDNYNINRLCFTKSGDYTITGTNNDIGITAYRTDVNLTIKNANLNFKAPQYDATISNTGNTKIINSNISCEGGFVFDGNKNNLTLENTNFDASKGLSCILVSVNENAKLSNLKVSIKGSCTMSSGEHSAVFQHSDYATNERMPLSMGLNSKLTLINKEYNNARRGFVYSDFDIIKSGGYFVTDTNTPVPNKATNSFRLAQKQNVTQTVQVAVPNTTKVHAAKKKIYMKKKTSLTLRAKGYSKDVANPKLRWKSSKPKVATVNQNGKVKAKKTGTTKITATAENGKKITFTVKVVKKKVAVKKLKINNAPKKLKAGKSKYLTVTTTPKKATNTVIKWKSSNKKVLTVDKAGRITAKKKGKVKLTAKIGKKKVTETIKVTK